MDIVKPLKNKKRFTKTHLVVAIIVLVVLIIVFQLNPSQESHIVNRETLLIDTVKRGDLNISVRGTGVLAPMDIRWIATNVPGRVERVLKKPGAIVKKGELLLELSNPALQQQLTEAKWELQARQAETEALKVALESELLDQEIAVISEQLNLERARLTLDAQSELLEQGIVAISKIDFAQVKIDVRQFEQLWQLEQQRLEKRRQNLQSQITAADARLNLMRRRIQLIQQQVNSLHVIATMDSIIQEMPIESGQQVEPGRNLAMLASIDRFIAQLNIPEILIKDVLPGQKVLLDTRSSKIEGRVQRIEPAVTNSTVQVDVE